MKTDPTKERILQQVKADIQKAKKSGKKDFDLKLRPGYTTSLSRVIKTKEQADFFMKMLNAL